MSGSPERRVSSFVAGQDDIHSWHESYYSTSPSMVAKDNTPKKHLPRVGSEMKLFLSKRNVLNAAVQEANRWCSGPLSFHSQDPPLEDPPANRVIEFQVSSRSATPSTGMVDVVSLSEEASAEGSSESHSSEFEYKTGEVDIQENLAALNRLKNADGGLINVNLGRRGSLKAQQNEEEVTRVEKRISKAERLLKGAHDGRPKPKLSMNSQVRYGESLGPLARLKLLFFPVQTSKVSIHHCKENSSESKWYIAPDSKFLVFWNLLVLAAVVFQVLLVPLVVLDPFVLRSIPIFLLHHVADVVNAMDIVLHAFCGFYEEGTRVQWLAYIRSSYFSSFRFYIALFCVIPFDIFGTFAFGFDKVIPIGLLCSNRVLRMAYIHGLFAFFESNMDGPVLLSSIRLSKLIIYVVVLSLYAGLGWISFSIRSGEFDGVWLAEEAFKDFEWGSLSMIHILLWGMNALSSGIGEEHLPTTIGQYLFSLFVSLCGVFVFASVIGNISRLIATDEKILSDYHCRLEQVARFMGYHKLNAPLRERVLSYYRYMWIQHGGFHDDVILADLPFCLKTDIEVFRVREIVGRVEVLRGAEKGFVGSLVNALTSLIMSPGEYVVRQGSVAHAMYFVHWGQLCVLIQDKKHEIPCNRLESGDTFGEFGLVVSPKRTASVRAVSFCHLFSLAVSDLRELLAVYPDTEKAFQVSTQRAWRIAQRREEKAKEIHEEEMKSTMSVSPSMRSSATNNSNTYHDSTVYSHGPAGLSYVAQRQNLTWGERFRRFWSTTLPARLGFGFNTLDEEQRALTAMVRRVAELKGANTAKVVTKIRKQKAKAKKKRERRRSLGILVHGSTDDLRDQDVSWCVSGWMMHPSSPFRNRWTVFQLILAAILGCCIPIQVCMYSVAGEELKAEAWYTNLVALVYACDFFHLLHILVQTRTAFFHMGMLIVSPKRMWIRYRRSWLAYDLASLPLDWIGLIFGFGLHPLFFLTRLLRLRTFSVWAQRESLLSGSGVKKVLRLVLLIVAANHFVGCLFLVVSCWNGLSEEEAQFAPSVEKGSSTLLLYLHGLRWSLRPRGLGQTWDATLHYQVIYTYVISVAGVLLFSFVIGKLGGLVYDMDAGATMFRKKREMAEKLMKRSKLPRPLVRRVRGYYDAWWSSQQGVDANVILGELPESLRADVLYFICARLIRKSRDFADCDELFIFQLVGMVKMQVVPQGEFVFQEGEMALFVFLLSRGVVELVQEHPDPAQTRVLEQLESGSFFGEQGLVSRKRLFSSRALSAVNLLYCPVNEFRQLVLANPDSTSDALVAMARGVKRESRTYR